MNQQNQTHAEILVTHMNYIYRNDGRMCTNLNELIVCHVSTVKCLLVIHKSWEFSLLNLFATQHQYS